ncbi:tRNA (adenosine(37)-N6)-threonylcarbamoyltransferase complex dimerization subunit type 1 TsaB, partial [uncultured Olegusella sp.]|uniref:tRNA (adenosine(37)-N6)-threonylcarbamoyltransferase complex dimerization subunit type 1 TsaB n=1 Tax=uncultured Olegusella sp. TaxID=1979846 RepID=UPI002623456E
MDGTKDMNTKQTEQNVQLGKLVLALDTSTDMLACAVGRIQGSQVELLTSSDHLCRRKANVELVTTCEETLAQAGLSMEDLDAVLVGRGPGSFTGVRIGIATGKGIACGANLALYGASALDAVAWSMWKQGTRGKIAVAADAMRGEVYPGIYVLDEAGVHRTFETETVMKAAACAQAWGAREDRDELLVVGGGLVKHRAVFESAGMMHFAAEQNWLPTGEGLLMAAASADGRSRAGNGDPALVLPVYTRLSDAEESERQRLGLALPASVKLTGVDDALASIHLQLRPMSVNDLDAVVQLEQNAFQGAAHTPWTRAMFFEELSQPGRSWWVAHDRGQVIGFAGGMLAG